MLLYVVLVCNPVHMHSTFKNNHNYIYIYIYIERERERERWVQVTPGVTLINLHLFYTVDFLEI